MDIDMKLVQDEQGQAGQPLEDPRKEIQHCEHMIAALKGREGTAAQKERASLHRRLTEARHSITSAKPLEDQKKALETAVKRREDAWHKATAKKLQAIADEQDAHAELEEVKDQLAQVHLALMQDEPENIKQLRDQLATAQAMLQQLATMMQPDIAAAAMGPRAPWTPPAPQQPALLAQHQLHRNTPQTARRGRTPPAIVISEGSLPPLHGNTPRQSIPPNGNAASPITPIRKPGRSRSPLATARPRPPLLPHAKAETHELEATPCAYGKAVPFRERPSPIAPK